jgi:putative ABC transport system substrate-binding protein
MGLAETDHFTQGYVRELRDRLQQLGWTDSRKIQFIYRYAAGDPGVARAFAKELVEMQPDLIVGHTTPVVAALSQTTRTVPVVFVSIPDPVLNGFVTSMARPGT